MLKIEISDNADDEWNKRLITSGFGTTAQLAEAALIFKMNFQKPIFLKFINSSGKIVGQLLMSEFSRFDSSPNKIEQTFKHKIRGKILKNVPLVKNKVIRWSYGPILFDNSYKNEISDSLILFLQKKNVQVSGWEHPLSPIFSSNSLKLIPWCTFLIDLKNPIDEIYQKIDKHSGRKNIERSINRGVVIEEINENNLLDYFKLKQEMGENLGGQKQNFDFFLKRWKILHPIGQSGFLARKNNIPIGGLLFTYINNQIIEGGVARSKQDFEENLYSQDLIKWKIIEWGVKNKMDYYNLAGCNPKPVSKKEQGIYRYKKKWGGKQHNYFNIQLN